MTKARLDGLYLVVLGALVFVLMGSALETVAPVSTVDFRVVYYSARCLLDHRDPYNENDLQSIYLFQGGETSKETPIIRLTETQYIYPPTAFLLTLPFAILPFGPAQFLWLAVTASSVILAALAMWDVGAKHAPVFSGALICLTLANSELFLVLGNPAGIVLGFCVIAVWCFIQERFVWLGVFLLALSLMLKPHDVVFVWVYFLFAPGRYRKSAVQTLLLVLLLSLPILLWVSHAVPHWIPEMRANLVANSAHGGLSDPGPKSMAAHGIGMIISLQAILSAIRDDSGFYNPITYLLCGGLLAVWLFGVLKTKYSSTGSWFALAPIAALSMLPIYHRIYDARLLLLAIPASAILWTRRGPLAWTALIVNVSAILLTGGIPWAIFFILLKHIALTPSPFFHALLIAVQVAPVPLILLATGVFYLWVFLRKFPTLSVH
jgi:hypothetical protein